MQITVAQQLHNTPHGQFVGKVVDIPQLPCPIRLEYPKAGSFPEDKKDFSFVESRIFKDSSVNVPWKSILDYVVSKNPVVGKHLKTLHQKRHVDFGFSSGHLCKRRDTDKGVPSPSELNATRQHFVSELMANLSSLIVTLLPHIWLSLTEERLDKFARQIHKDNRIEFMRIAVTDVVTNDSQFDNADRCHFHEDTKNDRVASEVVIFSKVLEDMDGRPQRISIICCQRKSVADTINRFEQFGPSDDELLQSYGDMSEERKSLFVLAALIDWSTSITDERSMKYVERMCHMDSSAYSSPLIHQIVCLKAKFDLDYCEVLQLVVLHGYTPNSTFYLCAVLHELLQREVLQHRGTALGRHVAEKMLEIVDVIYNDPKKRIPGLRYSRYSMTNISDTKEVDKKVIGDQENTSVKGKRRRKSQFEMAHFSSVVQEFVFHTLSFAKYGERPTNRDSRKNIYRKVHKTLSGIVPNCGELGTNHLIFEMSVLGILPFWMSTEFWQSSYNSLGFRHLRNNHGLPIKNCDVCNHLIDTLTFAVEAVFGMTCTRRTAENIVCKSFCLQQRSEARFKDLYIQGQYFYHVHLNGISVIGAEGHVVDEVRSSLIDQWNWKGSPVSLSDIGKNISKHLETLSEFSLPREFNDTLWLHGHLSSDFANKHLFVPMNQLKFSDKHCLYNLTREA